MLGSGYAFIETFGKGRSIGAALRLYRMPTAKPFMLKT